MSDNQIDPAPEAITTEDDSKDKRWAKQFGDFAELLVMHLLGQGKNMSVALVDHVGADLFAVNRADPSKRYAISVKGRIVPEKESKNYRFTRQNIDALRATSDLYGMEPAVGFVFIDSQEGKRKIRIFFATLSSIDQLAHNEDASFISPYGHGAYVFRWTEGRNKRYLSENFKDPNEGRWAQFIDYSELTFDVFNNQLHF